MSEEKKSNGAKQHVNFLDNIQVWADSNIRLIQNTLYIIGGVGAVIVARSIYMTKVFTSVDEIPVSFIKRRVKLRGKVTEICDDGVLRIEHIPIVRLRVPFWSPGTGSIPVHLACIDISPEGRLWLTEKVWHKVVWFHLLHRSHSNAGSHLYTKLELPKMFGRNIHVNEELIRQGLATISSLSNIEETGNLATNKHMLQYLDRLVKLEHKASTKGIGIWTQSKDKTLGRKSWEALKFIISSPFKVIRWIYKKGKGKK